MNGGKTYSLYCDESSHLESDGKEYMLISYVSVPFPYADQYKAQIRKLKEKHHFYGEIKWSKVSRAKYGFYADLIDLFFGTEILFRSIVVPKARIRNTAFGQDYDTFYYKMYYQLLYHKMDMLDSYNIYLDVKDTLSPRKVDKLKEILSFKYSRIRNLQNIRSHESLFMQLADFLMGALAYNLNEKDKPVLAKTRLIEKIRTLSKTDLLHSTPKDQDKFNIFIIDLK